MNDVLKQRLVGALILVALGVVFWPIIFVEPGDTRAGEELRVPPRPDIDRSPLPAPDLAGLRSSPELAPPPEPEDTAPPEALPPVATEAGIAVEEPNASDPVATSAPTPAVVEAPAPAVPVPREEAPEKPALDAQGVPISWILRVASVSSEARAEDLRKSLVADGYKAYSQRIKSNGKTLYRVYVGPKMEKARLEDIKGAIDRAYGVDSLITRYYP